MKTFCVSQGVTNLEEFQDQLKNLAILQPGTFATDDGSQFLNLSGLMDSAGDGTMVRNRRAVMKLNNMFLFYIYTYRKQCALKQVQEFRALNQIDDFTMLFLKVYLLANYAVSQKKTQISSILLIHTDFTWVLQF